MINLTEMEYPNQKIMRLLSQAQRMLLHDRFELAKERYNKAWHLMHEIGEKNLFKKTVTAVYWLQDNYYPRKTQVFSDESYYYEGRILAQHETDCN